MNDSYKKFKKSDLILWLIIIIVIATVYAFFYFIMGGKDISSESKVVSVYYGNECIQTFSLSEDIEYDIKTDKGLNRLVIKNGAAFIESADCPDKICVNHVAVSGKGEEIICIPHKLVIVIE